MNSRREFLEKSYGLGAIALATLMKEQGLLANPALSGANAQHFDMLPKPPHSFGRAKSMISMFMQGGPRDRKSVV